MNSMGSVFISDPSKGGYSTEKGGWYGMRGWDDCVDNDDHDGGWEWPSRKTHHVYLTLSNQIEGQLGWFPLMVYGDFPWLSLKDLQTRLCNKITPAPACGSWSPHRWCWCSSPQKAKVIFPKTGAEPHSCLWPSFKGIQRQTNIKIMC